LFVAYVAYGLVVAFALLAIALVVLLGRGGRGHVRQRTSEARE
jgi:hypothetical protein